MNPDQSAPAAAPSPAVSGQVLITGIVLLLVLLLAVLFLFDLHNLTRAKFKVETGQQAAALAGADWQKESLNLIGEINLIKACSLLLEGEANWDASLPSPAEPEAREAAIQSRLDQLTEMQTRVSFIGPLIGFAAAQQAAKANGMPAHGILAEYIEMLQSDWRYREEYGGASRIIRQYRWREPYTNLVTAIAAAGIAVFPNARVTNAPVVHPAELASEDLYLQIMIHKSEIAASDPPPLTQTSWLALRNFLVSETGYPFTDADYRSKWWEIDYTFSRFPGESEIYTLGISTNFSSWGGIAFYDDGDRAIYRRLSEYSVGEVYRDQSALPGRMNWFCYDESWYPEYYRSRYSDYERDHYDYWFGGEVLRRSVRPAYRYEGPAAYAEGYAEVGTTGVLTARRRLDGNLLRLKNSRTVRIGTERGAAADSSENLTSYRPGAIAKPLGAFDDGEPPIAVPLILPVFNQVALQPTYMPIPYGFGVLRSGYSQLERFLNWLSGEESLFEYSSDPPAGTDDFLTALQTLADGAGFRYYGWNPNFDAAAFDAAWRDRVAEWPERYISEVYSQSRPSGPGWLQQPRRCYILTAGSGRQTVPDYVNGGTATRVFTGTESHYYYVVTSGGHIVTNDELDPTLLYNSGASGGGSGPGFGGHGNAPDTQKGPSRF